MLFGCFLDAFWMLFGCFLVAFWEPLGPRLLELLGSCGKDLGCLFVFVIRFVSLLEGIHVFFG